jgi:hypothetical protein
VARRLHPGGTVLDHPCERFPVPPGRYSKIHWRPELWQFDEDFVLRILGVLDQRPSQVKQIHSISIGCQVHCIEVFQCFCIANSRMEANEQGF